MTAILNPSEVQVNSEVTPSVLGKHTRWKRELKLKGKMESTNGGERKVKSKRNRHDLAVQIESLFRSDFERCIEDQTGISFSEKHLKVSGSIKHSVQVQCGFEARHKANRNLYELRLLSLGSRVWHLSLWPFLQGAVAARRSLCVPRILSSGSDRLSSIDDLLKS